MKAKKYHSIANELIAGTISGVVMVIIITAVSALVFKGTLSPYFSIGIGCVLIGTLIVNSITACFGSIPYAISRPEPAVGAIIAIMFLNIASSPLNDTALLMTLLASFMTVTLLVGFFMFFLGSYKLGQIARFLPYPVLGGVIVGSGWIIARSSIYLIANNNISIQNLSQPDTQIQLGLAMVFALFLLLTGKRSWVLPVSVLLFSFLINIFLYFQQIFHQAAIQSGWLFSSVAPTFIFDSVSFSMLNQIDWSVITHQIGYLASISGLIVIILLLNITALETSEKFNADLEYELKLTGIANIIGGLFCAFPCNLSMSGSILNKNIGGLSRYSGLAASCCCMFIFLVYPHLLLHIPVTVIGGLLLFIAFKLMIEWLYHGWYKLPRSDYLIILTIGLIIAVWNFLPGTSIGIIVTCIVFVIHYAKINTIKFDTSGKYYHSNVIRPAYEHQWLVENGHKIRLFKLQGYLFFGSTKLLLDNLRRLIASKADRVQFLIFDFQLVNGFDSSANISWIRLQQLISPSGISLIFTHCSETLIHQLKKQNVINKHSIIQIFPDIDQGLEWCEQKILESMPAARKPSDSSIVSLLGQLMPAKKQQQIFAQTLEKFEMEAGQCLVKRGDDSDSMYFIESGEVITYLDSYKSNIRLAKSGAGTIVGELGFYLHIKRTASIYANTKCVVYELKREALDALEKMYPDVAVVFHKNIVAMLGKRLVHTNYLLEVMGFL